MASRIGGKVAAGALLALLAPRLAAAQHGYEPEYQPFDLKVMVEPGLPSACTPEMNVSGVYRFRMMSPYGAPVYEREGNNSVWSFYFADGCGDAGEGWFFTQAMPSEDFVCDLPGRDFLWFIATDIEGALNLTDSNETWTGQCGDTENILEHMFRIEPMAPDDDELFISGLTCDPMLNGIYTRAEHMSAGRPVFVREDWGSHVLAFYDDLHGYCPQFEGMWVLAPYHERFEAWAQDDCFFEAMLEHPSARPVPGMWQESCEEVRTLVKVMPRTRTGQGESVCNMDFMMYLSQICPQSSAEACSRSCHVMLDEAHRLCTYEDRIPGMGSNTSILDQVRMYEDGCGPQAHCLEAVNQTLDREDFEHCWDELCGETPSEFCSETFYAVMDVCENTSAEMNFEGMMMPVDQIMSSMAWCQEMNPYGVACSMGGECMEPGSACVDMYESRVLSPGEGCSMPGECICYKDPFQGQCVMIPQEKAMRLNVMPCSP